MPITRFDVFIPGDFPEHSYVNRTFKNDRTGSIRDPESEILEALNRKGIIMQVVGPSKSGKTIALEHVITSTRLIKVPSSRITTADSLWQSVISQLGIPMHKIEDKKKKRTLGREFATDAKVKFPVAEFGGSAKSKDEDTTEEGHQVKFGDDLFEMAVRGLTENNMVLLIDDFHTINKVIKADVATQLKAAAEMKVKICLAEVPHRADEPISANPDLTGRVQKVNFEYWSMSDLKQIGKLGFEKLRVDLSQASLETLAGEAGGSPQLMQLFCLEAAKVLGIEEELSKLSSFGLTPNEANSIFINVVQQVERESIFNILDRGPEERGNRRNRYPTKILENADNYEITLAAIALNPPREQLSWNQERDSLEVRIGKICKSSNRPQREQISRTLSQMVLLAEKYMPNLPIIDWDENKGLHILDPYFLFYLRWSKKYMPVRESI